MGDSSGAYEEQDVQLAEVGAAPEDKTDQMLDDETQDQASGEEQLDVAEEQEDDAEQQPFVSEDAVEGYEQDLEEEGKIEADVLGSS